MLEKVIGVFVICMLMLSFGVYAIGESTGFNSDGDSGSDVVLDDSSKFRKLERPEISAVTDRIREKTRTAIQQRMDRVVELRKAFSESNCEEFEERTDRIRCRLVHGNYTVPSGTVPEACRNLSTRGQCIALYATIQNCYRFEGAEKDRCFKKAIGLRRAALGEDNSADRPMKARYYAVALLYHLQEKVEIASEKGRIDPDDAADLINKIVEIKQVILDGEASKAEVRAMMRELKDMWREIRFDSEEGEDE